MPEQDLDTRIRELVARAVADAPRAPELDPGVVPLHGHRRDPRRGWWVGAGAALVAAAAAITTVVLVADTDDRISTPNTQPSTGPSVPTVPTNTSVPPAPSTPTPTPLPAASDVPTILTAGLDGVVERRGDEVRSLTTEPTAIALAAPDGRILVQQPTGEGDAPPLVLDPTTGSTTELFGTADWDGIVRMHDVEQVGGRQLLLVSLVRGSDQPDASTEAIYVVDLATAARTELHAGVGSVRSRLTMAPSGLVVGEVADDAGVSFLALAVPGSPAAQEPLPTAEQLGLQASYPGCDVDCPRMYTVLPDGVSIAWIEGFEEASIVEATLGEQDHERIALPFPPQGSGLDVAADGSFLLARSSPDVRAMRVARDGSMTELEGTIATAGAAGATSPAAPAFEVTERDFVAAAGPNGVVLRTATGDLARRLQRPASVALPVGDGRVVVQLDESAPSMWLPDGSVEELFPTTDAVGPIHAQDVAIVEGRPVLLYVAEGAPGEPVMVGGMDLLTNETRDIAPLPGSFDETYRLHLGANGLVVGNTGSGLFVTSWPNTSAATLVAHIDEQTMSSDPSVYTVSSDGTWVAQLEADGLVEMDATPDGLGEPRRWVLPFDTTGAVDFDVSADGVIVNFGSGQDARYARRDGSFGVLEGPVGVQGPGTVATGAPDPAPATTTTTTTSTTVPAGDTAGTLVMAGSGGVTVVEDVTEVRRLDQPAEVAFLTPGGAVIFQPARATRDAEPDDPLIWRPDGTVERLLGELPANQSYRLYDVANVAGVPTVLYGLRTRPENGDPAGYTEVLNALAMAPGGWTTVELTQVGTYEAGFNGLSLSAEGIVLGTYGESVTTSLFAMAIPASPAAGEGVPDAASLGLEPSYGDCDCPGNYAISADSGTIAWLDRGDVVVFDVETGETQRFQHPALAGFPVRLDIRAVDGGGYDVVIGQWSNTDATPIDAALFRLTPEGGSELPLGTEFASFSP